VPLVTTCGFEQIPSISDAFMPLRPLLSSGQTPLKLPARHIQIAGLTPTGRETQLPIHVVQLTPKRIYIYSSPICHPSSLRGQCTDPAGGEDVIRDRGLGLLGGSIARALAAVQLGEHEGRRAAFTLLQVLRQLLVRQILQLLLRLHQIQPDARQMLGHLRSWGLLRRGLHHRRRGGLRHLLRGCELSNALWVHV
jgi:hypothetical protein